MTELPAYMADEESRLNALPDASAFRAAGFRLFFNGGGCTAWFLELSGNRAVMMTSDDGMSADPLGGPYMVAAHDFDSDYEGEALMIDGPDAAKAGLALGYVTEVGYDPFTDDPAIGIAEVAAMLAGVVAEANKQD